MACAHTFTLWICTTTKWGTLENDHGFYSHGFYRPQSQFLLWRKNNVQVTRMRQWCNLFIDIFRCRFHLTYGMLDNGTKRRGAQLFSEEKRYKSLRYCINLSTKLYIKKCAPNIGLAHFHKEVWFFLIFFPKRKWENVPLLHKSIALCIGFGPRLYQCNSFHLHNSHIL